MRGLFSRFAVIISAIVLGVSSATAQQLPTRDDAVAFVKKAVEYVKINGKEKSLAEFNNPSGRFIDRELYIVVLDLDGMALANGVNPKMVGKNLIAIRDRNGNSFASDAIELAKSKGRGWLPPYEFFNPAAQKMETKWSYVERVDNMVVLSGVYR
ncbi:MAG TPA: cache domain-containing protein [Noviherbaspirillum sp.]|nr:cache domain-containing protein [Noviherbaspirillum sp.]